MYLLLKTVARFIFRFICHGKPLAGLFLDLFAAENRCQVYF
jgi:hypothetical protein